MVELEASAPEAVATMVEQCKLANLGLSADGTQSISMRSGRVQWDAATRPKGITHVYGAEAQTYDSAAASVVGNSDIATTFSKPYSRILPAVILDCIAADPTTPLAQRFRLFARHVLVHGMRQVSDMLQAHAAVVETPPMEWCGLLIDVGFRRRLPSRWCRCSGV